MFANELTGTVKAGGVPGDMGVRLKRSLLAMLEEKEDRMLRVGDEQEAAMDRYGWNEKDRGRGAANVEQLKRARERAAKREASRWTEGPDGLKRKRMADGNYYTAGELTMPEYQNLAIWERR